MANLANLCPEVSEKRLPDKASATELILREIQVCLNSQSSEN